MKLKLPFRKLKYVCTTDQILDKDDNKLSDVLSGGGGVKMLEVYNVARCVENSSEIDSSSITTITPTLSFVDTIPEQFDNNTVYVKKDSYLSFIQGDGFRIVCDHYLEGSYQFPCFMFAGANDRGTQIYLFTCNVLSGGVITQLMFYTGIVDNEPMGSLTIQVSSFNNE